MGSASSGTRKAFSIKLAARLNRAKFIVKMLFPYYKIPLLLYCLCASLSLIGPSVSVARSFSSGMRSCHCCRSGYSDAKINAQLSGTGSNQVVSHSTGLLRPERTWATWVSSASRNAFIYFTIAATVGLRRGIFQGLFYRPTTPSALSCETVRLVLVRLGGVNVSKNREVAAVNCLYW